MAKLDHSRFQTSGEADMPLDVAAYLSRIGHDGRGGPGADLLRELQRDHIAAIPFEALDVLTQVGVDLSPGHVEEKLVARRRGGYCFEQNGLFRRVLEHVGFEVEPRIARVVWGGRDEGAWPLRTHMCLLTRLAGEEWLVDVGFGTAVPTGPLLWNSEAVQPTPLGSYRLSNTRFGKLLELKLADEWVPVYEVYFEPPMNIDLEVANWFTSTHPMSIFTRHLIVARVTSESRISLFDRELTVRGAKGEVHRETLDLAGVERVLGETFGLPVEDSWWPALKRIAS
ncbi:arylamine N-acetyltransferase family protein [Allosphingosinicella deserti]|nr:arylamine N-acetyltransferase [Sphingomonas deserti]